MSRSTHLPLSTPMHRARPCRRALLIAALLAAGAVHAAPWTSIGSAGIVDEGSVNLVDFMNGEARIRSNAAAGSTLTLRYNLVALAGVETASSFNWQVRFRDNGGAARVRLYLRRYNSNGTTSTLATFDSDQFAANSGYQTQTVCINTSLAFNNGPVYIEAQLLKSGDAGTPALGTIGLMPRTTLCPVIVG